MRVITASLIPRQKQQCHAQRTAFHNTALAGSLEGDMWCFSNTIKDHTIAASLSCHLHVCLPPPHDTKGWS